MLSLIFRYKSFFPRLLSVNWVPWGPILFDMNSLSLLLLAVNMRFMFFESFLRLVMWSDIKRFTVLTSSSSFRYCPSPGIIRETQTLASERSSNQLIICLKSVVIALVLFPIQRSLCPACKKTNSLLVSLILWRIVLISFLTSARFWQILPPPPSCQQLSALSDPLMTSVFARPSPLISKWHKFFKEPPTQYTNWNTKCLSYPA